MHRGRIERVYLINWEGSGVFKVGYTTDRRRPVRLCERGGSLLALSDFEPGPFGLEAERTLHRLASSAFPKAFTTAAEAVFLLGRHGGWTECYRGAPKLVLDGFQWEWVNRWL